MKGVAKHFACPNCKKEYSLSKMVFKCTDCKEMLDVKYDYSKAKKLVKHKDFKMLNPMHWKYFMFYPIENANNVVSLFEGGTPLIKSDKIKADVSFKYEGTNPTGSFKDRGSTIEITKAVENNADIVVCASTGNMGASIAAYSTRAGLNCKIFLPTHVPKNKVEQIKCYGANLEFIHGEYSVAVNHAEKFARDQKCYLTGDYPFRCEGQKSIGFEISDQLGWNTPNYIICPVGNGTVIYSIWKAFNELKLVGLVKKLPKMIGMQAEGCSPVVDSFNEKFKEVKNIETARTVANAIACEAPTYGNYALRAVRESKGMMEKVSDRELIDAVKMLGSEGVFAEPAGAASVAGFMKLNKELKDSKVVCIISGHGLKDPII